MAECLYLAAEIRQAAQKRLVRDPEAALDAAERIETHAQKLQSLLSRALRADEDLVELAEPPAPLPRRD